MANYCGNAPPRPRTKIWADTPVHLLTVNAESSFLIPEDELNQLHNGISIEDGPLRKVAYCTWAQLKGGNVGRTVICQDGMPEAPKINSRAWVVTPAKHFRDQLSEKLVAIQGPDVEAQYGRDAIFLIPFSQAKGMADGMPLDYVHEMVTRCYIVSERPGSAGLQVTLRSTGPGSVGPVF